MRLVVFGDGKWAGDSVVRLAAAGHDVAAVVPRARPTGEEMACAAAAVGARLLHLAAGDAAAADAVRALGCDLGISVAYDRILRAPMLAATTMGVVNFHAGMLPRYRGRNVVNWAILNGEQEIGVTAHWVDLGIDSGDIILQRALPITRTDDYGSVLARVVAAIPPMAVQVAAMLAEGRAPRVPQEHALATYYGGRHEGDEWLDWSATSRELHDKIRAIARPGPGARTTLGEREVVIWRAWWEPWWPRYAAIPGQVVGRRADGACAVKTGDSTLLVLEAQPEGGESGAPGWQIGTRLGERDGALALRAEVRALRRRVAELERAMTREVDHVSR